MVQFITYVESDSQLSFCLARAISFSPKENEGDDNINRLPLLCLLNEIVWGNYLAYCKEFMRDFIIIITVVTDYLKDPQGK